MVSKVYRGRLVHPFPARMAPDIALASIAELTDANGLVLDPMCGSGTVLHAAGESGRRAVGFDVDPLAVIISEATCRPAWSSNLAERAEQLVRRAKRLGPALPSWIDRDEETASFVGYWFAALQAEALSRLARALADAPNSDAPLRVALSRLIVRKDGGASLARDTAHSRPHRVADTSEFDVFSGYIQAARALEELGAMREASARVRVRLGDARALTSLRSNSIDLVVTSPPYLNAIDYLRGHRMSLVWLGWTMAELRAIRGESIGTERQLQQPSARVTSLAMHHVERWESLPHAAKGMVYRFVEDMDKLCRSFQRLVRPGGHVVLVLANSQMRGALVRSSEIVCEAAKDHGLFHVDHRVRPLAARHRYLPPPALSEGALSKRMDEEVVLTLEKPAVAA